MSCSEDECSKIAEQFERDVYSKELKELSLICGGKETDQRIVAILRHATELGYMEMLTSDE